VLSAAQVIALAREEGLGEADEDLLALVRPGWRIVSGGDGRSRVGGSPDLAAGESWPVTDEGVPFGFVAQIDCSALPPIAPEWRDRLRPWKHDGRLLRLFANTLDDYELGAACALACDPAAELTRARAPRVPDDFDEDDAQLYRFPETAVRFEPFLTAPETEAHLDWSYRLRIDGAPNDETVEIIPWEVHHVLGEGMSVQDDIRWAGSMMYPDDPVLADEDAWQILLGLHTDHLLRLEIFDGGSLQILAPIADLAEGRLDRLVFGADSS
jgi:uncharacterized protein DUF1963